MKSFLKHSLKFIFLFCFLLTGSIWPIDLSGILDKKSIGKEIWILEDRSKSFRIEDVLKEETNQNFVLSTEEIPNFGQTNYYYWIKIPIENKGKESIIRLLEIDYSNIDLVEVYSETNKNYQLINKSGMMFPFSARSTNNRNFVYPLELAKESSQTIYIKLYNGGGLSVPITIWEKETFSSHYADIQHGLGLYYGVMLVMILYNFFIFLSVRDLSYLYYVIYIFGFLGVQLTLTGHGFQYLWPNLPEFQRNGFVFFCGFCIPALILFAKRFLNTKENLPYWLNQTLNVFLILPLIQFPLILFLSPEITVKIGLLLTLPAPVLIFITAIISFVRRYRPARFFLLAFTVLIGATIVVAFKYLNLIPENFLTEYGLYIGSASEVILLSIALADRINIMKEEKEVAQSKAIEMQKILTESYARFVPKDFLANLGKETILDVKLGDQIQKYMAVLFSDIRSFTTLSEQMSPEQNFNFINSYLGRMSPIIQKHNGFIDKFIGDAIMALFERNITDAIFAGVDMQLYLKEYNHHRNKQGYVPIQIGIGIHAGSLMLGTIGAEERLEGTVISDTVNLASRVQNLTKIYGAKIAVTEAAIHAIDDKHIQSLQYRFLDRVRVKGKTKPVSVYEILNGDDPIFLEQKLNTKTLYLEATTAYHSENFAEAKEKFETVAKLFPEDKATQLYLKRLFPRTSPTTSILGELPEEEE
ncbi:guanylate cyclase [Leptospira congkakensis]|uniref:Guanylate cyclase n=1 Tax=Leptospira congkakensis TaxID=2484932 RepID=A0A4Z1AIY0_9LEPT|nr:7TM diverse intracellular signaling domain-containing protein [Leptospira congkakensis]TGL88754.1 guanylate cyclase [Leptospira congkakensis]TGL89340.1 guanylate cyclase [Leptospira congkakensis]TGL97308.1 guanylate cyclase [Leptospira congkakensis]